MASDLLSTLKSASRKEDIEICLTKFLEEVKKIVSRSDPDSQLEKLNDLDTTLSDLLLKYDDKRLNFLTLEIFAELAKTDFGRLLCTNVEIIKLFLSYLLVPSYDPTSNVSIQACRALGNTCFECDSARNVVKECQGEELLLKLMVEKLAFNSNESHDHLKIACGAFMNTIADHEILQLSVLSLGALDVLCKIIKSFNQHDDLMKIIINILELLFDHVEKINSHLKSDDFIDCFLILLKESKDQEIIDSIFQILSTISENDGAKLCLSSTLFAEKLCELVEQKENDTELKFTDLGSDFVVLLLTGDESMNVLFSNGDGKVFLKLRSWLSMDKSVKLQTAGAFALCNVARSNKNCIYFVENGVLDEILSHLKHYPVHEKQPVLQHALIGTLANLSKTAENKNKMVEKGIVEECLKYLNSDSLTVVFKSLGTIRMLLNAKVSCQLCKDEDFLGKLLTFASQKEHEGVRCESWRIVATMVKTSQSDEVMEAVFSHDLVQCLLELLQSKHLIMKNEAILTLILMISNLDENILESQEELFCEELKHLLLPEISLPREILSNVLILIKKCHESPSLRSFLLRSNIRDKLLKHEDNADEDIRQMVVRLTDSL